MHLQTNFLKNVHCLSTPQFLAGGHSTGAYDNFNLATHTGDNLDNVVKNRQLLQSHYQLPSKPKWLNQTHSNCTLCADDISNLTDADASWTQTKGVVCAVLTADCLPIFISNITGDCIGIIHAGYQGLLNGVIESFISTSPIKARDMLVHIGVGISQAALGLDEKMRQKFINKNPKYQQFFIQKDKQYHLDMPALVIYLFNQLNIQNITQTQGCTYQQSQQYFSYRRQGANSGRMASLIWLRA